jgi:hypothetical protein
MLLRKCHMQGRARYCNDKKIARCCRSTPLQEKAVMTNDLKKVGKTAPSSKDEKTAHCRAKAQVSAASVVGEDAGGSAVCDNDDDEAVEPDTGSDVLDAAASEAAAD